MNAAPLHMFLHQSKNWHLYLWQVFGVNNLFVHIFINISFLDILINEGNATGVSWL